MSTDFVFKSGAGIAPNTIIEKYTGTDEKVVIPEGVIRIDNEAFKSCKTIKEVVFPSTLKEIGEAAFSFSSLASKLVFPPSLTRIEGFAFWNCKGITDIQFTHSIKFIGLNAFSEVGEGLEEVILPDKAVLDCCCFDGTKINTVVISPNVKPLDDVVGFFADLELLCKDGGFVAVGATLKCIKGSPFDKDFQENVVDVYGDDPNYHFNLVYISATEMNEYLKKLDGNVDSVSLAKSDTPCTKSFNLFGQEIMCSNKTNVYIECIEHYTDLKDQLIKTAFEMFPPNISANVSRATKNTSDLINNSATKDLAQRLSKHGIPYGYEVSTMNEIQSGKIRSKNNEVFDSIMMNGAIPIMQLIKGISDIKISILSNQCEELRAVGDQLLEKQRNSVTGLDYGIITSSSMVMTAYAIDDFLEKKRQKEQAYKEFKTNFARAEAQITNTANKQFSDFMINKGFSLIEQGCSIYADILLKGELDMLVVGDVLDKDTVDRIDIVKSNECLASLKKGDNEETIKKALGSALKYNPCNESIYEYVLKKGYADDKFLEMLAFVGLIDKYKPQLLKNISSENVSLNDSFMLAEKYEVLFDKDSISKQIKSKVSMLSNEVNRIAEKDRDLANISDSELKGIIENEISNYISEKNWICACDYTDSILSADLKEKLDLTEQISDGKIYAELPAKISEFARKKYIAEAKKEETIKKISSNEIKFDELLKDETAFKGILGNEPYYRITTALAKEIKESLNNLAKYDDTMTADNLEERTKEIESSIHKTVSCEGFGLALQKGLLVIDPNLVANSRETDPSNFVVNTYNSLGRKIAERILKHADNQRTIASLNNEKEVAIKVIEDKKIELERELSSLGLFNTGRKKEIKAELEQIPQRIKELESEYNRKISLIR